MVDLWGSKSPSYTADTLTNVFSRFGSPQKRAISAQQRDCFMFSLLHSLFLSTKSLTAIAMAALYDEGLISYDARFQPLPQLIRFLQFYHQKYRLWITEHFHFHDGQDCRLLARVWSEGEGQDNSCWLDETWGLVEDPKHKSSCWSKICGRVRKTYHNGFTRLDSPRQDQWELKIAWQ